MTTKNLIAIETLCAQYDVEMSFLEALEHIGRIEVHYLKESKCVPTEQITDLEKMIRMHHDLEINPEGIDVVFNLLEKEKMLKEKLVRLTNRLSRYEDDLVDF